MTRLWRRTSGGDSIRLPTGRYLSCEKRITRAVLTENRKAVLATAQHLRLIS